MGKSKNLRVVIFKNIEATQSTENICANSHWFEDHSRLIVVPKRKSKGSFCKVITAAMIGGDWYPASPNGEW